MNKKIYTDLFRQHRSTIDGACAGGLNAPREKAFDDFDRMGFPPFLSEDYQQTNLEEAFAFNYGLNFKRLPFPLNPENVFRCDVPNLSTALYFVVNDGFYVQHRPKTHLPESVFSGSLNAFAAQFPEIFQRYYTVQADTSSDELAAFNTMFVQDGYVLYIPENTILERPIQLINILTGNVDALYNRRMLVIVGKNAQAKLLVCDHTSEENHKFLTTQVTEIFVDENAVFDLYELEESSINTTRVASTFVSQQAGSNVMINATTLYNGLTRNNYYVDLNGEHAETGLSGIAILGERQHTDNFVKVVHHLPNCSSNQLFKYVLDDHSTGVFTGRILVDSGAQKTNACQTNKNLCVTREAKMFSKPQLEIYADDVKCSHGMTTGQLDENALFYLRSRGIPEKQARLLLMYAFTVDVLDHIRIDAVKDRLRRLVEKRFKGELSKCAGCCNKC
ncbi:MAG: Fe-S cluster assembly protein SufD [Dysgonamonadaceae bacterium]|jgi:Fe-S cluster assembly protein SufD|nr:Fe-S cluster assembly protein SufD [Dysgonamonadaceae bacterium]